MATSKFLATKGFHPGSRKNRSRVYEAEERERERKREEREREEALKREQPKVDLPGVSPLSERVFKALEDVKYSSVDVYVTESATVAPESKNLGDEKNALVGVGMVRGDSERFGANKFWVVVIYAH